MARHGVALALFSACLLCYSGIVGALGSRSSFSGGRKALSQPRALSSRRHGRMLHDSADGGSPAAILYAPLDPSTPATAPSGLIQRFNNTYYLRDDGSRCTHEPQLQLLPADWTGSKPTNWWWSGWTHKGNNAEVGTNAVRRPCGGRTMRTQPWQHAFTAALCAHAYARTHMHACARTHAHARMHAHAHACTR